jgi:hypothetical protein
LGVVGIGLAIDGAVSAVHKFNGRLRNASRNLTISPTSDGRLSLGLRIYR